MKKVDYLFRSIANGSYLNRVWLLSVFGILPTEGEVKGTDLVFIRPGVLAVTTDGVIEELEDYVVNMPVFSIDDKFTLPAQSFDMTEEEMTTTFGIFMMNMILFYYPYQGKVKYVNGKFKAGAINNLAYDLLKSGKVSIEEHIRFENAASFITCLTQVAVPSASRKSITPNDAVRKRRDELLKENKGKLHDPAVVAKIQKELSQMDREYLKDDPSAGFFIKDKSYDVARLRMMGMYGAEPNFQDETKIDVMTPSLSEGWEVENLPMLVNSLRSGSYSRGKETAMGGESTKITTRIFQNFNVSQGDCGTKEGMDVLVSANNISQLEGRYLVGSDVSSPLSVSDLTTKVGEFVKLRSPLYCKQGGTDLCEICVGKAVSGSSVGLNAQAVKATSAFMDIFMQKTHGRALQTERYDYRSRIT